MANNDQALVVDKKDIFLVKPSKATPSCVLSFSSIDNDYNIELLVYTIHVYKASDHDKENNLHDDPAGLIKDALSRVLVYYYPMAGKLKRNIDGKLRITCNADGVPYVEAIASCSLSSLNYLDGIDLQTAREFVVNYPNQSESGYHPLVVQVTKFSCGGFAIGMGLCHAMCDGVSASQFLRALADLVKGENEPLIKPVWERELLVVEPCEGSIELSFQKTTLANSPYLPTIDLLHEFFNISGETIKKMRSSLIVKGDDIDIGVVRNNFTSLEIISAYIWRSMFRALDLNSDGDTVFTIITGIRHVLKNPPLPQGYYGNSIVLANSEMSGKQINEGPFLEIVETIKESKTKASDPDYIWKAISIIESITRAKPVYQNNGACVFLTDWRHLGFMEVDFGSGEPVNLMVLPWSASFYMGMCMLLPSCKLDAKMKGGMRVYLTLPRVAMNKMRAEMDAIHEQMDYIK